MELRSIKWVERGPNPRKKTLASIGVVSMLVVVLGLLVALVDRAEAVVPVETGDGVAELFVEEDRGEGAFDDDSFVAVVVPTDDDALLSGFAPPDHVVRAMDWDEELVVDDVADPRECAFSIEIPARQLRADHPQDRARVGLQEELSESQREDVTESMLDEGQLHAQAHETIGVESLDCRREDGQWRTRLEVTIRGETERYEVPVELDVYRDGFAVEADFEALHEDFGMEPYSAYLGAVRNDDPLTFVIEATGRLE